jgi:mitochondrial chaperone BCS1
MFSSLDPIWLFLGGLVIRYGGDLLKIIVQFGLQRLACQITIAETNPIYSAICWELEQTSCESKNSIIFSTVSITSGRLRQR